MRLCAVEALFLTVVKEPAPKYVLRSRIEVSLKELDDPEFVDEGLPFLLQHTMY